MDSRTKRRLPAAELVELVKRATGMGADVASEFTDGYFNAVYAVTLDDGRDAVLKIAPDPAVTLLRYEVDLMHAEWEFFARAAEVGVPVPGVIAADPDEGYLLLERLTGTSLESTKRSMTAAQLETVRRELGELCSRLGRATGPVFGYPRRDGHSQSDRWRTSFLTMVDDILTDAVEYQRELPAPAGTVRRLIAQRADVLDEVTTPVLVHFDLWDGNVFVVPDGDGYRVEGVIDGERAFYGDPIAELTSLAIYTDPAQMPGLLDGFLGRPLTGSESTRLRLYRIYLYLIMVTEGATRDYPDEYEPIRRFTLQHLDTELGRL
ncbi:phosphotransferase family protein [Phytoactinopolyspora halotolerans]|uniref:Aminoglycoside phosphotransferase family protein n=1 Tax=Phytoactinopolyspora halotolerans TaxID=1981512 RepID=A0A6L9S821_9ACTN|nr:aminoglycoside phosphotransferase family protein [Phytoactinopolyspora halotolerans]NEE00678.1 aminoglycoside phosphotransferase family protein [Phytoactinopolyspora halotolerans]